MVFSYLFCNSGDVVLCDYWIKSHLHALEDLKKGALEVFGISDVRIDQLFQKKKMNPFYFIFRIRESKGKPSVYYFYHGEGVLSYLEPADELILWRSGSQFRDYLVANMDYVEDSNEPEDRG